MNSPHISVIIAAYHSDAVIEGCLQALRLQTVEDFEVIVVNSSPGDRTRELVATRFPEVKLYENPSRLLPHAARNRGVLEASGDLLVFSDADCRGAPDWLERLSDASAAGHDIVCGSIETNSSDWFEIGVHLCKYSFRLSTLPACPARTAGTANACYSRAVWSEVGPFDGDVFCGDGLLSWAAAKSGRRVWFESRAIVEHQGVHCMGSFWKERVARGRDFADMRVAFEGWSRLRLAANIAAFPLLPLVPLARGGRDAVRAGRLGAFILTAPIQFLGHLGWSVGELQSHWRQILSRHR